MCPCNTPLTKIASNFIDWQTIGSFEPIKSHEYIIGGVTVSVRLIGRSVDIFSCSNTVSFSYIYSCHLIGWKIVIDLPVNLILTVAPPTLYSWDLIGSSSATGNHSKFADFFHYDTNKIIHLHKPCSLGYEFEAILFFFFQKCLRHVSVTLLQAEFVCLQKPCLHLSL